MMCAVTEEGGTGTRAAVPGYKVAGKTGTAQMVDPSTGRYAADKYTSIFTGFVPADDPRLVMAVVIHEPRGASYGGVVAAPIFKNIAARALAYLGVPPSNGLDASPGIRLVNASSAEGSSQSRIPLSTEGKEGLEIVPDVTGLSLKMALLELASLGVRTEFAGSGKVIEQQPPEGAPIEPDTVVELVLSDGR